MLRAGLSKTSNVFLFVSSFGSLGNLLKNIYIVQNLGERKRCGVERLPTSQRWVKLDLQAPSRAQVWAGAVCTHGHVLYIFTKVRYSFFKKLK